jgi:hypothetical protein
MVYSYASPSNSTHWGLGLFASVLNSRSLGQVANDMYVSLLLIPALDSRDSIHRSALLIVSEIDDRSGHLDGLYYYVRGVTSSDGTNKNNTGRCTMPRWNSSSRSGIQKSLEGVSVVASRPYKPFPTSICNLGATSVFSLAHARCRLHVSQLFECASLP